MNEKAREAALAALRKKAGSSLSMIKDFQLNVDEWLSFLKKEAKSKTYSEGQTILGQGQETDSLFQVEHHCLIQRSSFQRELALPAAAPRTRPRPRSKCPLSADCARVRARREEHLPRRRHRRRL